MLFLADTASHLPSFPSEGQTYNYMGQFVNMLLTLGFIIILIVISVTILKKIMRSRVNYLNQSTGIKILEKRMLNQKSALYVIDVLGKGLVLSDSPAGIRLLTEFPPGTDLSALLEEQQIGTKSKESFSEKFKRLATKKSDSL